MKVIIAGSRNFHKSKVVYQFVNDKVKGGLKIEQVLCGCARGVDEIGRQWALDNNVPVKEFPADWNKYGRAAGHIRNSQMVKEADALIAVWDGKSRGTKDTIDKAETKGIPVFILCFGKPK